MAGKSNAPSPPVAATTTDRVEVYCSSGNYYAFVDGAKITECA